MSDPIRIGPSPIHGLGVFAKTILRRGERVIQYLGEKITKEESARRCERQNGFIFSLDDEFDLDGDFDWNPARLVNHSCAPNCEAECLEGRIWITALRDILPGEEITFNYGYDWEAYQEHPCHCGATECVGFILAGKFFGQLRRRKTFESLPPDHERPTVPAPRHTNPGADG
ncbi:MAG: SET domain-containing protein-lysine N-methyltransferase [Verrucomicrobiota bacterium]